MTTETQQNQLAVIADPKRKLAERVDGLRKLMMMNKDKLAIGAAGLLNPERMIQVACLSIRKNPDLLEGTIESLFGALSEAGTYGWVCDGIMGQASLVLFNNTKKKCKEVTLIPGYKGLRQLVERSGECMTVMQAVHEGDEYEYRGALAMPLHERSKDPERKFKAVTHAYVIGQFNNGRVKCFSWTVGECKAHRDRYAQSWRRIAGKKWPDGKSKEDESPWCERNAAFPVMCMKSVMLDAIHRGEFPMSVEDMRIVKRDNEFAEVEQSTVTVPAADLIGFGDDANDTEPSTDDNTIDAGEIPADQAIEKDLALAKLIDETIDSIKNCTEPELIERIAKTAISAVTESGGNPDLIASARQVRLSELEPKGKQKQKELA